jgi:hypothetical protein
MLFIPDGGSRAVPFELDLENAKSIFEIQLNCLAVDGLWVWLAR